MRRFLALILALAMTLSAVMPSVALAYDSADTSGSSSITEQSSEASSEEASASKSSASEPEPEPEQPAPEAEPEDEPEQPAPEAEPEAEPEQSGDAESEPESSKDGSLYADTSESAPEEAPVLRQHTLRSTLKTVDGVRYQVTVAYDDTAEIPKGTRLSIVELNQELSEQEQKLPENQKRPYKTEEFVTEKALEQESFDLLQGLEVRDKDLVLFTKFLDLELKKDGRTIQPKSAVTVTVETDVVEEGASDALEVALYNAQATLDWQKERKKLEEEQQKKIKSGKLKEEDAKRFPEKVYTTMLLTNETQKKKGVKLSFEAEELARMGVCAVGGELKTWKHKGEKVSVFGPRRLKADVKSVGMKDPRDGLEKMGGFSVELKEKEKPDYDVTFWVGRRPNASAVETQADDGEDAGVAAYSLKDGKTKKELLTPEDDAPAAIEAGDKIGLVWDTGLRDRTLEAEQVTLSGLLPKRAHVETNDMLWRYSRPEALSEDVQQGDAATLAAYDISIENRGAEYQPEADNPVTVRIQAAGIDKHKKLQVWHLGENDAVEVIEDFQVSGDTISFEADRFSVYLVVQVTKEQVLTASDGNQYKITVTYGSDAGIPAEAELNVSELKEGKKYNKYVKKAAKALGRKQEHLAFAHAFDIKLVNPETGEHYQPTKPVAVSIELYKEDIQEGDNVNVVHFPDSYAGQRGTYPGNPTEGEILGVNIRGEAVEFESSGFSVYVVTSDALLKHFVFLNGNDSMNDVFAEQVLIDGENLVEPAMPTKSGAVFDHWELVTAWSSRTETVSGQEVIHYTATESETFAFTSYQPYRMSDADKALTQEALDQHANKVYFRAIYGASKTVISYYNQSGLVVQKNEIEKPAAGEAAKVIDTRAVSYLPIQDKEGSVLIFKYWTDDPRGAGKEVGVVSDGAGGWDETNAGKISITSASPDEIILYPALDDGHYLHFDANKKPYEFASADFIPAETVLNGMDADDVCSALNARANHGIPTTTGYTFAGWYISASKAKFERNELTAVFKPNAAGTALEVVTYNDNGTEKPVYNKLLDSYGNLPNNPTLYAHWTPVESAPYTVIVWKQKVTDDKNAPDSSKDPNVKAKEFDYEKSYTFNGTPYTTETVDPANLTGLDTTHFHLNTVKSETSGVINPDGTTVLNIYYDRDLMTFHFKRQGTVYTYNLSTSTRNDYYYIPDGNGGYTEVYLYRNNNKWWRTWTYNYGWQYSDEYVGDRYTRSQTTGWVIDDSLTMTGLYGQEISKYGYTWPSNELWVYEDDTSHLTPVRAEFNANLELLRNADAGTSEINYYKQNLDGSWPSESATSMKFGSNTNVGFSIFRSVFTGFTFSEYRVKSNNSWSNWTRVSDFSGSTVLNQGLEARFVRDQNTLTFADARTGLAYDVDKLTITNPTTGSTSALTAMPSILYEDTLSEYKTVKPELLVNEMFTGWYYDRDCTAKVDFDNDTMPAAAMIIYAGYITLKNRAILIPNGGDMGGQGVQFHLDEGEKVQPADPTRDFIPVELKFELADPADTGDFDLVNGNPVYCPDRDGDYVLVSGGAYEYDPVNGAYFQTEHGEGNYSAKAGAYTFMGWYEAELNTTGEEKLIVEYKADKYTYAWGHYKDVGAGNGSYALDGGEYRFVGEGAGQYNFVNAQPQTDGDGQYVVKRDNNGRMMKFDTETAPIEPVTLVALWQRAGDYRVVYDVVDPALNLPASAYIGVTAPEDQEEYIDDSHAIVLPAIGAPKGYKLDAWVDKQGREWKPNQLVPVNERNADVKGNEMIVTLHAKYSVFDPSERNMADYRFMINTKKENGALVFGSDYTEYELQRIAVNEELKAPITPEAPEGYAFKGWYYDTKGTSIFNGFGVISNPVYTTLYAVFVKVYNVSYYLTDSADMEPTNTVIATQTYRKPNTTAGETYERLDTRHINHPVDQDHYVVEWQAFTGFDANGKPDVTTAGTKYAYNTLSTATVEGDLKLYAVLRARSYLSFDSCGGSFVEQVEIPYGSWPARPKDPTRPGFFFDGWFTKKVGGVEYEFDKKLTELKGSGSGHDPDFNTDAPKLYAHWSPNPNSTEKGTYTVIWWAQTADRPESDAEANADTSHYQIISMQTLQARYDTYSKDKYSTAQSSGGLGLMTNWNDLVTVLTQANAAGDETAASFIRNTLSLTESTAITPSHISQMARYYEYNSSLDTAVDAFVTVDDSGSSVLNIRFVLKKYTFKFNANEGNFKVYIHAGGARYQDANYSFQVWLGKDVSAQWPIDSSERNNVTNDANGAWVEKRSENTNDKFNGWTDGTNHYATLQPTADRAKIDIAFNESGTYTLTPRKSTNSTSGSLHYMEWNGEQYVEMDSLREDVKLESSGYNNAATGCNMPYYKYLSAKDITNYNHVNDENGEPGRNHNHYGEGKNYAHWVSRNGTVTYDRYVNVYKNTFNQDYAGVTFYSTRNASYPLWDLLHHYPSYSYDDPVTEYVSYRDADLDEKTATDGTALYGYSRTENNIEVKAGSTVVNGKTMYYQDSAGNWNSMDWALYLSTVFPYEQKTYHYTETVSDASGYDIYFYYEPQSFILTLIDRDEELTHRLVMYKSQLTGTNGILKDYSPTKTAPAGKAFVGWSAYPGQDSISAAYSSPDGKMPPYNLTLYAIWAPIKFTVTTLGVDADGVGFLCNEEGKEVDAAGNLVANGKVSAVYENVDYGTELRSVGIVDNPKMDKRLFKGWLNATTNTSVTGVYKVVTNLTIKPQWTSLDTRKIQYLDNLPDFTDETTYDTTKYASFASQGKTAPAAPTDPNAYVLGAKVTVHDSNGLYVYRKDVDGQIYKADFAFWEDSEGNRYYPNTTYVFREDNPGITEIGGIQTLVLKAVYSEYRETILLYDKNADDAQFVIHGTENETPPTPYTNKVVPAGEADAGRVRVLYRDWLNEHWASSFQHKPNDEFPIGEDEDYVTYTGSGLNPYAFTVIRSDSLGNEYIFAGWTDETGGRDASLPIAQNGDKAYVNTIKDGGVLKNILYAVWGICKVVDNGEEHVFDTIQKAVDYVSNHMSGKTGTIEMLIDYKIPESVSIPSGSNITLTTATTGVLRYLGTGNATITRASTNTGRLFTNSGAFTTNNITLDGGNVAITGNGGLIKAAAGTVTVGSGSILQNSTATSGGAIYAASGASVTISGGTITGSTAENGAAIYGNDSATININGGRITGNTATSGGAVEGGSTINFSGAPFVYDNKNGGKQKNVVLDVNSVTKLHVSGALDAASDTVRIGVFATDITVNRWKPLQEFATYGNDACKVNLDVFTNDRNEGLYGVLGDTTNQTIKWVGPICKIVDSEGKHPFATLNAAVTYARTHLNGEATIQMLVDYVVPRTDAVALNQLTDKITLTTADVEPETPDPEDYYFTDTQSGKATVDKGTAILTRGFDNGSLFTVVGALTLGKVILDGDKANHTGNAVQVNSGATLTVGGTALADGENAIIRNFTAANGGAVYTEGTVNIQPGASLTGNTANTRGGAIYAASGASVAMTGGTISGNTSDGGAIATADTGDVALTFSGSARVSGNTRMDGTTAMNVYLTQDSNAVINMGADGLSGTAEIGVYVDGDQTVETSIFGKHGAEGMPFGTYPTSVDEGKFAGLACFTNDILSARYGATIPGTTGDTAGNIYWADYIARVSNDNGANWTYFEYMFDTQETVQKKPGAFNFANGLEGTVAIETLKETASRDRYVLGAGYTVATDPASTTGNVPTAVTLRTTQDAGWNGGTPKFRTTLTRGSGNTGSMFTVPTGKSFTTENIVIDGGAKLDTSNASDWDNTTTVTIGTGGVKVSVSGGIVNVENKGSLDVGAGSTLQDSVVEGKDHDGGAVYVASGGSFAIEGEIKKCASILGKGGGVYLASAMNLSTAADNARAVVSYCKAAANQSSGNGGGIYIGGNANSVTEIKYIDFDHCVACGKNSSDGGAGLYVTAGKMTVEYCDFTDNSSPFKNAAGIFHYNTDKAASTTVNHCNFTRCKATGNNTGNSGGAMETDTTTVNIAHCNFTECQSTKNGGAVNIYNTTDNNGTVTVDDCVFVDCKAIGTDGGALRLNIKTVTASITDCQFTRCKANNGGAIASTNQNISNTTATITISGSKTKFENNEAVVTGGAIYLLQGTLSFSDGEIKSCVAPNGGGIYQAGGTCDYNSGTIEGCMATKSSDGYGGGFYLKSGIFNLKGGTISQCKSVGAGGGIYLGGGSFSFTAGSVKECVGKTGGGIYANVSGDVPISASGEAIVDCEARNVTITSTPENGVTTYTATTAADFAEANKGGGIYLSKGNVTLTNATIKGCKANTGGGIYLGGGKLNINNDGGNGVTIQGNTAEAQITGDRATGGNGGGIYLGDGSMTIESLAVIKGNAATASKPSADSGKVVGAGGGVYMGGDNKTLTLHGTIGGTDSADQNTASKGGGIYQAKGTLNMESTAKVIGNKANGDGGGIYLGGGTLELKAGTIKANEAKADTSGSEGNGGGIYLGSGDFKFSDGTIGGTNSADANKAVNGGGLYQGGGTMTMSGGYIRGNTAEAGTVGDSADGGLGGGIYLGGGSFTLRSGEVGVERDEENPQGLAYGGNQARKGGGLYVGNGTSSADNDLTKAHIEGGVIGGNYATEVAGGGGIAIGGEFVRLYFSGNIQVWGNTMTPNSTYPLQTRCDVCLNVDSNDVIRTTSTGLIDDSHIGVYVPDQKVTSGANNGKWLHEDLHGTTDLPFGTFDSSGDGDKCLERFINNRSGYSGLAYQGYEYYYGVRKPDEEDPDHNHYIYWAKYICEITDEEGHLLFTNDKATAPALYQYLGTHGAFEALCNHQRLYKKDKSLYTGKYCVRMLDFEYELRWNETLRVPANVDVTLMMAKDDDNNLPAAKQKPAVYHDTYNGCTTIKRGRCTSHPMFTTEANSKFTIQCAIIDGGAKFDDSTGQCTDGKVGVDGALINAGGNVTLGNKATLQNSVIKKTGNNHYGAAVWYYGPGTFTMDRGSKIQRCYATGDSCGGAVLYVKAGESDIVNFAAPSEAGQISNCTAKNGLVYVRQGTLNLTGAFSGEPNDPTSPTNVVNVENCSSENGGLAFVTGGTLNLGAAVSGFRSDSTNASNGGVLFVTGGTANLTGTVSDCTAKNNGGAAYVNGSGTLNLNGTIQDCEAPNGGGVCAKGGTVHLEQSGSKITNCTASNGGAIFAGAESNKTAVVIMNAGELSGNTATGFGGGAIRVESDASVTIRGGTFTGNTASNSKSETYGGAINIKKGTVTIYDGTFSGNSSTSTTKDYSWGGAIHVAGTPNDVESKNEKGKLFIHGGTFCDNYAGAANSGKYAYGGAISMRGKNASVTIDGGTFSGNRAINTSTSKYACGGAIAVMESAALTLSGGTISGNYVKNSGDSAYAKGPGIYLGYNKIGKTGSKPEDVAPGILNLSGSPNFGGTGIYREGTGENQKEYLLALESTPVTKTVDDGNGGTTSKTYTLYRRYYKKEVTSGTSTTIQPVYPDGDSKYYMWEDGKLYTVNSEAINRAEVDTNVIPGIGNLLGDTLSGKTNGGKDYYQTREDIYIAGFEQEDDNALSLVVTGKLTRSGSTAAMDKGSIWVGTDYEPHYQQNMQFATFGGAAVTTSNEQTVLAESISETDAQNTMMVFRNAYDDDKTNNATDDFLYGEAGDGVLINWSGVKGTARVILKKVKGSNAPLSGAKFTVYRKNQSTIVTLKKKNGTETTSEKLKDKESGAGGVFWIGDLPYGTYYLHETKKAGGEDTDKWFYFILDENFQIMSTEYDNDGTAKTAGDAETTAVSWASKIISEKKIFSDLPDDAALKSRVKVLLTDSGHGDKVPST